MTMAMDLGDLVPLGRNFRRESSKFYPTNRLEISQIIEPTSPNKKRRERILGFFGMMNVNCSELMTIRVHNFIV